VLLAGIVSKYDMEPIESRPVNHWLNNTIGPPVTSTLRVRRRADTAGAVQVPVAVAATRDRDRDRAGVVEMLESKARQKLASTTVPFCLNERS
jgi:hypothetical protein